MLTNGCFGSTVTAQAASPSCIACREQVKCFEAVEACRNEVLALIPKRMARRSLEHEAEETVSKVLLYLRKSLVPPKEATKGRSRTEALRDKFDSLGINLETLRSRQNPFSAEHDGIYFHMGAFVSEGIPFTPKDMAEHLNECGLPLKSSSVTSEVSRFVATLVEAGILKKEKRIICLA